ncbi:MAG: hypothetical protein HFJ17_01555 [Clostridia bacterium]|nr:hypothetical protein [Clostridia bacterium]
MKYYNMEEIMNKSDDEKRKIKISELGLELSVRSVNVLRKNHYDTVESIVSISNDPEEVYEKLRELKNCGRGSANEIVEKLKQMGFFKAKEKLITVDHLKNYSVEELEKIFDEEQQKVKKKRELIEKILEAQKEGKELDKEIKNQITKIKDELEVGE